MEDNKKSGGLVISFIIVILLLLGLIGYICYDKFLVTKDLKNDTKVEEAPKEKIDFDATKYLGYVPLENNSYIYQCSWNNYEECKDVDKYVDAYSKDKVTINDISDRLLLNIALLYSTKVPDNEKFESDFDICGKDSNGNKLSCIVSEYYKASDVLANVKKLYNKDITPQDFLVPSGSAYFKNNYFALGFGAGNTPVKKISNMESAEIVDKDLIIEERAIFIFTDGVNFQVTNKTNYESENILKSFEDRTGDENWDSEEASKYAYQKISESNLYKHTFKKNSNGEYYWYSTELVK